MSERDKIENARRKGKKAYWDGVKIEQNPMRATDSWMIWREGWLHEQREHEASKANLEAEHASKP